MNNKNLKHKSSKLPSNQGKRNPPPVEITKILPILAANCEISGSDIAIYHFRLASFTSGIGKDNPLPA